MIYRQENGIECNTYLNAGMYNEEIYTPQCHPQLTSVKVREQ